MLNNKADVVEEYILKMLSERQDGQVELKRTDLADVTGCAPSQISYVLSTRFTNARGFKVESRRGLGGYIRITISQDTEEEKKALYQLILESVNLDMTFEDVKGFLDVLIERRIISVREAELAAQTALHVYRLEASDLILPGVRVTILESIFRTLSKIG